jgi:glucuronoarabinoxylan endo-1,4-beta-xylanase
MEMYDKFFGSIVPDPCWYNPRAGERIYRDFIYGADQSGVTITVWGLGVNRDCNITIWAYDACSIGEANRVANWYANGTYIFDTNFIGGTAGWPLYDNYLGGAADLYKYAFSGRAATDELGRIVLTSSRDPESPEDQPFAFVNAIKVEPNVSIPFVPIKYAQRPVPFDDAENVPIDVILEWKKGGYAETHDVYLGINETAVTRADRDSPLGVLVSENQSDTTYTPPEFLDLNTTYYWRIDEVNSAPDYTIFKGEVWSFKTLPYFVVDNFNSYEDNDALRNVWKNDSTSAEVFVETTIVRDGKSMRYWYENDLPPYYSEAYVDIADLGIDNPNWLGIGAETLILYFYGKPTNPIGEQMYVKLTDGDNPANSTTVTYDNMNDTRLKQWNKWSIALTEFTDVNLANVARITIGFGDGSPGNAGAVYFEDIMLDSTEAEVLPEVAGDVNVNTVYQQIEGFGGSACYDASLLTSYAYRETVYDLLFRDLGMDILRIKNTYDFYPSEVTATGVIVAEAREATRNPNLKTFLLPWSPPLYLKSDPCDLGALNSTLKKDANDPNWPPYYYVYDQYATWWLNSLTGLGGFSSVGIYPDYISIQNEPDWGRQDQVCRFTPTEDSNYAGYDKAFEAVYNRIDGNVSPMPKMLAPESMGFGGSQAFINALVNRGQINNVYGFSHHLYSDGTYTNPDGMIGGMINYHNNYGYKPLFQTEYGQSGDPPTFNDAVLMAQHIHNCLVYEGVTSYFQWTSFRASYTEGGMINLKGGGPEIRDLYWFFKHYAYLTDPNWYRVGATPSPSSDQRMTAFKSPDGNNLTIVILNKSASSVNLTLDLNGFPMDNSAIYRSSETEHWAYIGPFYEAGSLMLPARSITTISNVAFSNCDSVLDAGYGLVSDIHPDCYVNYEDLKIITDNWLRTDCTEPDNCEGADFEPTDGAVDLFDFSDFAMQWLWCNDPEDPDCARNW